MATITQPLTERDQLICSTRQSNPSASLEEIGRPFQLTRERVRQILKAHGLPTAHVNPPPPPRYCITCGKLLSSTNKSYCSTQCQYARRTTRISVPCAWCGRVFRKQRQKVLDRKAAGHNLFFCSRFCRFQLLRAISHLDSEGLAFVKAHSTIVQS